MFDRSETYNVLLNQQGATYVLMPLQKKVDQRLQKRSQIASKSLKKSRVIDQTTYTQENKKKHNKQQIAKKQQSKALQKSSAILRNEHKKKNDALKKGKQKKEVLSSVVESKKNDAIVETKSKVENIVEKESQTIPDQLPDPIAVAQEPLAETVHQDDELSSLDVDEPIFIGYQELEQSLVASKIAHTIQQHWVAPKGVSAHARCELKVMINELGRAVETKIMQSSGIFVYDARAKKALQSIEYPKDVWNKTIIIALGSV